MKTQEEEKKKTRKKKVKEKQEQEEQDGFSEHSPEQRLPLSSASSLPKSDQQEDHSQVELELKLLEALEIYPPSRLQVTGIHRHFVLYGMMEYLKKRFDRHFSADEILQLLDRFFNLEMMKTDDDDTETFNQEVGFSLPQGFLVKEEQ